jgi:hypothetical protein
VISERNEFAQSGIMRDVNDMIRLRQFNAQLCAICSKSLAPTQSRDDDEDDPPVTPNHNARTYLARVSQ